MSSANRFIRLRRLCLLVLAAGVMAIALSAGMGKAYADDAIAYAVYTPTQEFDSYTVTVQKLEAYSNDEDETLIEGCSLSEAIDTANAYLEQQGKQYNCTYVPSFGKDDWKFPHLSYGTESLDVDNENLSFKVTIQGNGDSTGNLYFFRSNEIRENNTQGTVTSTTGKKYTGTIYTGFESDTTARKPSWEPKGWEIKKVVFDDAISPLSCRAWFSYLVRCDNFQGLEKLNTANVSDFSRMFMNCDKVSELNLAGFNTSNATSMDQMFYGLDVIPVLDLSSFETAKVANTQNMFSFCTKLKTIYVGNKWNLSHLDSKSTRDMFSGIKSLVGPLGTACNNKDKSTWGGEFARVDGGAAAPGYLTLKQRSIKEASIQAIANQTFAGKAITPDVNVSIDGKALVKGTDYTLSYKNNTNVGTATATVNGIGEFKDSASVNFRIVAAPISKAVASNVAGHTYTGNAINPTVKFSFNGKVLAENTDYTIYIKSNVLPGLATITATGKGNFNGTRTITFKISPANISKATAASIAAQPYTGKALTPATTLTFNNRTLKNGTDYTVAYKNNTNAGTATATVTGKGNFNGTKDISFKVSAAAISKTSLSAIASQVYTGKAIIPATTLTFNGKTLAKGTDYKVSYKNNTNAGTATVTITGNGNFSGSRSANFKVTAAPISKTTVASIAAQTYTGKALKPAPKVTFNGKTLAKGTDYTLSYQDNVKKGTAKVIISGKGNFSGSKTVQFKIK